MALGHGFTHWFVTGFFLILPYLSQEFGLSFSQAGSIVAAKSAVTSSANLPAGAICDMFDRRRLLMVIAIVWPSLFYLILGVSDVYLIALVSAALVGFGSALWHAPAMSTLTNTFPKRKGFALSIHETGANLGDLLAPVTIGFMLAALTWRTTLFANILPAFLVAVLIWYAAPKSGTLTRNAMTWRTYGDALKTMFTNRMLLALSAISACRTMGQMALSTFLPIYLAYELKLDPIAVGLYVGILTAASIFTGPVMGTLSDRVGRRPILLFGLAAASLLVSSLGVSRMGLPFIAALFLLGLFLFSMRPVIFAYALDVTAKEVTSSVISFVYGMNTLFASLSPLIAGFIADAFGLTYTFFFVGGLILAAFVVALFLPTPKVAKKLAVS